MGRPDGYRYLPSHEWVRVEGEFAYIGITDYAVSHLQDLVFLDLREVGTDVQKDDPFGEIESVKAVSDLYAPVTGEIVERNERLINELDILKSDPYRAGWMLKVRMEKPSEVDACLTDAQYQKVLDQAED